MQSIQWRMNPFAVAQKTHMTQGGALGYEAQLVNAVITTLAPIKTRPEFEFFGDWSKIIGKVEERKSDKGGKYYVATWKKEDEEGLGVRCRATFIGESEPREVECLLTQCYPRFSTQWATDPQQQITYAAVRKWGRRYSPDVILGVYTPEELEAIPPGAEKHMGTAEVVADAKPARKVDAVSAALKRKRLEAPTLDAVLGQIKAATTPAEMETAAGECAKLANAADKDIARKAWSDRLAEHKKAAAGPSYAEIADQIRSADSATTIAEAQDLIRSVKDEQQRAELGELATQRLAELAPMVEGAV
jgi:hypothetical protein